MLTLWGRTMGTGPAKLGRVVAMELIRGLDSPADSLQVTLLLPAPLPVLLAVELWQGERTLFAGGVDSQREILDSGGWRVVISARSMGALTLDNEALPQLYHSPRLGDIFQRHIAPYGFAAVAAQGSGSPPAEFSVRKGLCEWEVLERYCLRAYGCRPYALGDRVVVGAPVGTGRHTVGTGGLGYSSLERVRERSGIVGDIMVRHPQLGLYLSRYQNPYPAGLEIRRKRYLIPSSEYADQPGVDVTRRIRDSMGGYLSYKAVLPGFQAVAPHDRVRLDQKLGAESAELVAVQVKWVVNADRVETRVLMRDRQYVY